MSKKEKEKQPEIVQVCQTCNKEVGEPRTDNGLDCGTYCDKCWRAMIAECRSRSW